MSILSPKLTEFDLLRRHPAAGAFIAVGVTGVCLIAEPWLGHRSALFVYLAAIVIAGPIIDRAGVFIMAAVSALAWNFFFTTPLFTFYMNDREDIALFVLFLVVTFTSARRARSAREREVALQGDEERRSAFYAVTRELTSGAEKEKAVAAALSRLGEAYDADVSILRFRNDAESPFFVIGDKVDDAVVSSALWAVENRLPITHHIEVPEEGRLQQFVLPVENELVVLSLRFHNDSPVELERSVSLRMIAHLFALALQREAPNTR